MKKHIKVLFAVFFFSLNTFGQDRNGRVIPYDSSALNLRTFDDTKLKAYQENSDFIYDSNSKEESGFLDRLKAWLLRKILGKYSRSEVYDFLYNLFMYVLIPITIIYIIWKLFGADKKFFLYGSSKKNKLHFEELPDNIQEINFDKLIQDAIGKKQFRLAVRLSYLLLLKQLSMKDLIAWSPEKTNHEYLREIKSNSIRDQFAKNSLMYEYVWYGDFEIDQDNYSKVSVSFQDFTRQIKEQK
jgi:hypothetical protein